MTNKIALIPGGSRGRSRNIAKYALTGAQIVIDVEACYWYTVGRQAQS